MAYLMDTVLNAYQSKLAQTEIKTGVHGVIPFVKEQTPFAQVDPDTINAIKSANGRTVDISAIKETDITVASAFSYDLASHRSETAKTSVTIYQLWTSFFFNEFDFANNAVGATQYLSNKLLEVDNALAEKKAEILLGILNTRRTQVFNDAGKPTGVQFNTTPDALTIALAQESDPWFDYIQSFMVQNKLSGQYSAVATPSLGITLAKHKLYSTYNDKNLMGQAFPKIFMDNKLSPTAGSNATLFFARNGAIASYDSIPVEFERGASVPGTQFYVGAQELAMTGQKPLVVEIDERYNGTGLTGRPTDPMTLHKRIGMGVSFAAVTSYNSDITTKVNDILKVELLSS